MATMMGWLLLGIVAIVVGITWVIIMLKWFWKGEKE